MEKAQLGLGHSYSRCKVKFNVNRSDNMITQAICTLDQLDKDINTFAMRVREWYGWHFPELVKVVADNFQYAKLCILLLVLMMAWLLRLCSTFNPTIDLNFLGCLLFHRRVL